MHPNPSFRKTGADRNIAFARNRGFGTLAVNAEAGPRLSHVPFLLAEDGAALELHLVRSNPILAALPSDAVIAVTGPDGYISPDWYGVDDQVPTWNYVAVHLRGRLETRPAEELHPMLDRLSAAFEHRLDKAPWLTAKMTPDVMTKMMRMIVPCRMAVTDIQGTWKLNQNKPEEVRQAAAARVADRGVGSELDRLAALMRDPPT